MNRREFIEKACLGGVGLVAGASLMSSLGIPTIKASPRPGVFRGKREIPLRIEDTPELQTVGGAYHLEIEEIEKNVLVVRTGEDTFTAVDIKCTHKGCDVKYNEKANNFICPCHDSVFDIDGNPKSGPAKKPLGSYVVTLKNGEVTVHLPVDGDTDDVKKDSVKVKSNVIDTTKKK